MKLKKTMKFSNNNTSFLVLVICFVLLRLLSLFSSTDLFYDKELHTGAIANELIMGNSIPLFEFQKPHHTGARLFMGIFTIPFFLLFGISGISLKLAILCFSSFILLAYLILLNNLFGKETSYLFGIFFIFSCPTFIRFNLINTGVYLEPYLFSALAIYFLSEIIYQDINTGLDKAYFMMGLCLGIGIWLVYTNILILFICILLLYFHKKKKFVKAITFLILGLLIGLLPWFYYNFKFNFKGVLIKGSDRHPFFVSVFQCVNFEKIFAHIKDIFLIYLPGFYGFSENTPVLAKIFSGVYYGIFLISFGYLIIYEIRDMIKSSKKNTNNILSKNYPFLLFIIIFLLVLICTDFADNIDPRRGFVGYRYLVPLYIFQLICISVFIQHLRIRKIKVLIISSIIIFGVFGMMQDISINNIKEKKYKFYRPYSYEMLGFHFAEALWFFDERKTIDLIDKININYRGFAFQGMGWEGTSKLCSKEINNLKIVDLINPNYRKDFFIGIGRYTHHEINSDLKRFESFLNNIPEEYLAQFYYGLGQRKFLTFQDDIKEWMNYPELMGIRGKNLFYYYQGVGKAIGSSFGFNKKIYTAYVNQAPERYRGICLQELLRTIKNKD